MTEVPYFVYQGPPVMVRKDPVTGYLVTGPWHINVLTGEIVSRFDPSAKEIPLDGRVIFKKDYPELFEILSDGNTEPWGDQGFVLPDLTGRITTTEMSRDDFRRIG